MDTLHGRTAAMRQTEKRRSLVDASGEEGKRESWKRIETRDVFCVERRMWINGGVEYGGEEGKDSVKGSVND